MTLFTNACRVVIVALFFLLPGLFRDHLSLSHPVTSTFSVIFLHVVWTNDKNFWGVFLVYFQIALPVISVAKLALSGAGAINKTWLCPYLRCKIQTQILPLVREHCWSLRHFGPWHVTNGAYEHFTHKSRINQDVFIRFTSWNKNDMFLTCLHFSETFNWKSKGWILQHRFQYKDQTPI